MFRWPNRASWRQTALIFVLFSVVSFSFGYTTGLFEFKLATDPYTLLRAGAIALVIPSLFEELLFRGPLVALQSRMHAAAITGAALFSLFLFVLWHPMNASFILTEAQPLFFDWRFLNVAFFLGLATTAATLKAGSIWPGVAIHWAAVMLWKIFFDGPAFF